VGHRYAGVSSFLIVIDRSPVRATPYRSPGGSFSRLADFSTPEASVSVFIEAPSQAGALTPTPSTDGALSIVLGDDQDAGSEGGSPFLGNGVFVRTLPSARSVEVYTSISGLPAVFHYRDSDTTMLASSVRHIAALAGNKLRFDPHGLRDMATFGCPIHHRTLFENLSVVPAGVRLDLVAGRDLQQTETWTPAQTDTFNSWADYIDAQVAAMKAAVSRRLDLNHSFLSLTAGLDTRAIFALLTERTERIPTFTMSGQRTTLDAMRASQLSKAYGFPHQTVSIDQAYVDRLPEYASEASLLSGGLASLGQAFEVHFYRSLSPGLTARISGNLGNQIGRSGTEGTGLRNVNPHLLSRDFRLDEAAGPREHWLKEALAGQETARDLFLIQNENLFASLGNYCIGSHFAIQQTPYADRTLISQKLRQPPLPQSGTDSILRIRLRDLRHRFLGQPVAISFQRRIVRDVGGFVSTCPVNWGWRARGGVSLPGLVYGGMAIADVVLGSRFGRNPVAKRLLSSVGVLGFSSFQASDLLGKPRVREFIADTLLSAEHAQNGVLDKQQLRQLVDRDVADKGSRADVEFALDVAMAQRHFLR